jgi:hypothetical protein
MAEGIQVRSPEAVMRLTQFLRDESTFRGERKYFIKGEFNQQIMIYPPSVARYHLFPNSQEVVDTVASDIEDLIGFALPEKFKRTTIIYNAPSMIIVGSIPMPLKVERQQIFLGAAISPIPEEQTYKLCFHAIGNALWNFLYHEVWREGVPVEDEDTERRVERNHYRELRNYPLVEKSIDDNRRTRTQNSLFYVASEDFRYLFGNAAAGRGEWYLDQLDFPVPPPNPEVANFWRMETARYDGNLEEIEARETATA